MLDFYNSSTWAQQVMGRADGKAALHMGEGFVGRKWTNGLQLLKLKKLTQELEITSPKLSKNGKLLTKTQKLMELQRNQTTQLKTKSLLTKIERNLKPPLFNE